jgi:hypothetical protein
MNKYRNKKTVYQNMTFDSKAEVARWCELGLLERAGKISGLSRQVPFELAPKVKLEGAWRTSPALRYFADFVYFDLEEGKTIIEDVKGTMTDAFKIKRHLMATVHGIQIRITK